MNEVVQYDTRKIQDVVQLFSTVKLISFLAFLSLLLYCNLLLSVKKSKDNHGNKAYK